MRRQISQSGTADLRHHRFEYIPVLLDRLRRPAVEAVSEPVINCMRDGVGGRRFDVGGDVLVQRAQLLAYFGLGPAGDLASAALAVGGVAERYRGDPVVICRVEVDAVLAVRAT